QSRAERMFGPQKRERRRRREHLHVRGRVPLHAGFVSIDLAPRLEIDDVHAQSLAEAARAHERVERRGEGVSLGHGERRGHDHRRGRDEDGRHLVPHGPYASSPSARRRDRWPSAPRGSLGALALVALLALAGCARVEAREPSEAISVLASGEPQSLDPRYVWDTWGLRVSRLIFASLFTIDPVTLEAVPDLAEGAERVGDSEWIV